MITAFAGRVAGGGAGDVHVRHSLHRRVESPQRASPRLARTAARSVLPTPTSTRMIDMELRFGRGV